MEKKFRVPVDDSEIFTRIMDQFNKTYKTDFVIENIDFLDGVEFVFLKFETAKLDDVFLLGYFFNGSYLRRSNL